VAGEPRRMPTPAPARAASLAPAGVGLAMFVAAAQIRMDDPWADGVLLLVAAVPAALLLSLGLSAARGSQTERVSAEVLLVAGLVLSALAVSRLGSVLGGSTSSGGGLTWMLALFTVVAAFCARRGRSVACLLIASLAGVGLLNEAVNWIFDTENVDTFRVLLVFSFVVLFLAGITVSGRAGTVLVGAAGVTALVSYYVTGFFFIFGSSGGGLGWGWELVGLLEGLALLAYAVHELEPGPGYLAFFVLGVFVFTAALGGRAVVIGLAGDEGRTETAHSLVGWPLALAIGTAVAAVRGLRRPSNA
jgi:hypothetical protein